MYASQPCQKLFDQIEAADPRDFKTLIKDVLQVNIRARDRLYFKGPNALEPAYDAFRFDALFRWYITGRYQSGIWLPSKVIELQQLHSEYQQFRMREPGFFSTQYWRQGRLLKDSTRAVEQWRRDVANDPWRLLWTEHNPKDLSWKNALLRISFHPIAEITRARKRFAFVPAMIALVGVAYYAKTWRVERHSDRQQQLLSFLYNNIEFLDLKLRVEGTTLTHTAALEIAATRANALEALYREIGRTSGSSIDEAVQALETSPLWQAMRTAKRRSFFKKEGDYAVLLRAFAQHYRDLYQVNQKYSATNARERNAPERVEAKVRDALATLDRFYSILDEAFGDRYHSHELLFITGLRYGILGDQQQALLGLILAEDPVVINRLQRGFTDKNPALAVDKAIRLKDLRSALAQGQDALKNNRRLLALERFAIITAAQRQTLASRLADAYSAPNVATFTAKMAKIYVSLNQLGNFPSDLYRFAMNPHLSSVALPEPKYLLDSVSRPALTIATYDAITILAATRFELIRLLDADGFGESLLLFEKALQQIEVINTIRRRFNATNIPEGEAAIAYAENAKLFRGILAENRFRGDGVRNYQATLITSALATQVYFYEIERRRPDIGTSWQAIFEAKRAVVLKFTKSEVARQAGR